MTDDQDFLQLREETPCGVSPCAPHGVVYPPPLPPAPATHDEHGRPRELVDLLRPPASTSLVRVPSGGLDVAREVEAMRLRRRNAPAVQHWRAKVDAVLKSSHFWIGVGIGGLLLALLVALGSKPARSSDF